MNNILLGIILIPVIYFVIYYLYFSIIDKLSINNNGKQTEVVFEIKKRTPDFILLETPVDKLYKNFCNNCKKNVDKIMITGKCSSCNTPNIPN